VTYVSGRVWKPELTGTIFPIYSSNILALLIDCRPGQLSAMPDPALMWTFPGNWGIVVPCEMSVHSKRFRTGMESRE